MTTPTEPLASVPSVAEDAVRDLAWELEYSNVEDTAERILRLEAALTTTERERDDATRAALEQARDLARNHKPERDRPLKQFSQEDREIIRSEENGEKIAAHIIAAKIDALLAELPNTEKDG